MATSGSRPMFLKAVNCFGKVKDKFSIANLMKEVIDELLSVVDTHFASIIVILKRFKLIKRALQAMVISDEWAFYREDDMGKANFMKEKLVSDDWWDKVAYIIDFTMPIYDRLRDFFMMSSGKRQREDFPTRFQNGGHIR
ncbi:hypothetical protein V6N11_009101 [Hibiscus sabdariffa]|uniref:Uncharacterized protein n=1 Tax=Hibiscus sabdariffa TaxID=183260 RepID=A0ABR2PPQ6_9ROSI